MALFLVELETEGADRTAVDTVIADTAQQVQGLGGELVEAQVTADLSRVYVIVEGDGCGSWVVDPSALDGVRAATGPDPVRLVGADLADVKAAGASVDYLVEWDIPAEITMEQYLTRKKAMSPRYEQVPDVSFLRTYVREDTDKCLCFYDAPDEQAVRRARDVVETPVSRLHALDRAEP